MRLYISNAWRRTKDLWNASNPGRHHGQRCKQGFQNTQRLSLIFRRKHKHIRVLVTRNFLCPLNGIRKAHIGELMPFDKGVDIHALSRHTSAHEMKLPVFMRFLSDSCGFQNGTHALCLEKIAQKKDVQRMFGGVGLASLPMTSKRFVDAVIDRIYPFLRHNPLKHGAK